MRLDISLEDFTSLGKCLKNNTIFAVILPLLLATPCSLWSYNYLTSMPVFQSKN